MTGKKKKTGEKKHRLEGFECTGQVKHPFKKIPFNSRLRFNFTPSKEMNDITVQNSSSQHFFFYFGKKLMALLYVMRRERTYKELRCCKNCVL